MRMKIELKTEEVQRIISQWVTENCLPPGVGLTIDEVEMGNRYDSYGARITVKEREAVPERTREPLEIEIIDAPRPE